MRVDKKCKMHLSCSKEIYRKNLQGIKFDRKNKRLIATNSHILSIIILNDSDIDKYDGECIIPPEAYKESLRTGAIKCSSKNVRIESKKGKQEFEAMKEDYPCIDAVIPKWFKQKSSLKITINAKLLHDLQQSLGADSVTLEFRKECFEKHSDNYLFTEKQIKVTTKDPNKFGLIMPIIANNKTIKIKRL